MAALRTLVLPFGASSGTRIVIDGVNGDITIYDAANLARLILGGTADPDAIKLSTGNVAQETSPATIGTTFSGSQLILYLQSPDEDGGQALVRLYAEDQAGGLPPVINLGKTGLGDGPRLGIAQHGTNPPCGVATLVAGTVTVPNTLVTATTRVFTARQAAGGTIGHLSSSSIAGTSFTITSSSALDTSTVAYLLVSGT